MYLFTNFNEIIRNKELGNLRLLNVIVSIIVTLLGFVFEFAYHDAYILAGGLFVSSVFISNYFLSFYSLKYRTHFLNISYASVFLLHCWAAYLVYLREFDIAFLLPVSLSIFIFSLIFDRFYKSFLFIFAVTTILLGLMWSGNHWQTDYTVAIAALYSGALVVNVILSRRTQYHREIEKREKQYIDVLENMNDGLIYINNSGELLFANERFCEITGYDTKEIKGKNIFALCFPANGDPGIKQFIENLKEGNPAESETELEKRNGQNAWVQLSGTPVFNDQKIKTGSMVVFNDISSLKETQEELKKREEGYRTFIDQTAVGIWRAEFKQPIPIDLAIQEQVDLIMNTGFIKECNDFMANMYGYQSSHELIGRRIRDFYSIENNFDEQKTREVLTAFIQNNYRFSNEESKEIDHQGNTSYMLNNNIGIIEDGLLLRTWGVQTDINDRKKAERELMETNQELDTFFYKASHDLKGPLASIMGIVNLARLENKNPHTEEYYGMIETSVKRLDRILLDLIELARTRKGGSKLTMINVKELVEEILQSLSHVKDFDKICIEQLIDSSIEIKADKVLMLSVFQNLIHNAINYSNQEKPWIRIHVRETDIGIELEVTDNGKGIPVQIKNKVFEMFYRGQPESGGSGLGLFIVKNAIDKMKGKIRFESEPNKGASFFVEIPNASEEKIAQPLKKGFTIVSGIEEFPMNPTVKQSDTV